MLASTSANLNYHDLDNVLSQPETEHNWAAKEDAIRSLGSASHSSIAQNHEFIAFIKAHRKAFTESLLTERTRLTGAACEMVEKLATAMGRDFGIHFADLFTGALLKVCARTNKVMVSRAVKALNAIINAGCLALLPKACQAFSTNNKTLRIACIGLISSCINLYGSQELEPYLASFEPVLKEGVSDAAPEVRDSSRKSYKNYAQKFPERSSLLTATLPSNVLKYLLPDTRSTSSQPRVSSIRASTAGRFGTDTGELARHQSSRDLTSGPARAGPSRIGPVRARTMAVAEQGPSTSFKVPTTLSSQHTTSNSQPYAYNQTHHTQSQSTQGSMNSQHQPLMRNHGPTGRSGSFADSAENLGAGSLRMAAQRTRALSSNSMSSSSMIHRSPTINLATNGGPQRVAATSSYSSEASKTSRPSSMIGRSTKVEPTTKLSRMSSMSSHSGHGAPAEREQMSASERAKAYSANLKNEMANRRPSSDMSKRVGMGARRVTSDHTGYSMYGPTGPSTLLSVSNTASSSATASTTSTSAATSTTSTSPTSSTSASPTTLQPPNHDHLFSSFRAPNSPHVPSSPPESCPSPERGHSTPPNSQPIEDRPLPAPLSPTFMAQVSLEGSLSSNAAEGGHDFGQPSLQGPFQTQTQSHTPLSPRSPAHSDECVLHTIPTPPGSANQTRTSLAANLPVQDHGTTESQEDVDITDAYLDADGQADVDQHMSVPDHESLFGNTDNYLQMEQEISELQQSFQAKEGGSAAQENDGSSFMDEDSSSMDHEQLAVKAYAEEYEATLLAAEASLSSSSTATATAAAATSPSSSQPSSREGE
ncbi:hypothetical protein EC968_000466 [Mortierella alpina]|nr:hypothetical protein EC968_000466 [Mortierella alpina]